MTAEEKIKIIKSYIGKSFDVSDYYSMMEELGDLKKNYHEYAETGPIDCNYELRRLDEADYDLATAIFTMLLREDHFCEGRFERRARSGQVEAVLNKMVELLEKEVENN